MKKSIILFIYLLFFIVSFCVPPEIPDYKPPITEVSYSLSENLSPTFRAIITWKTPLTAISSIILFDENQNQLSIHDSQANINIRTVVIDNLESQYNYYFRITSILDIYSNESPIYSMPTPKHPLKYNIELYPKTLPDAEENLYYSIIFSCYDNNGAVTYTSTDLPSWLSINEIPTENKAMLEGTPTEPISNLSFHIKVTDEGNNENEIQYTIDVINDQSPITLYPDTLPNVQDNTDYSIQLYTYNNIGTIIYSATGLPDWLSLNPTSGVLSGDEKDCTIGACDITSVYNISITVTDSTGDSDTNNYTLIVSPDLTPIQIYPDTLPNAERHTIYNFTLGVFNANGSYTFSSTNLPSWLSIDASGNLTGTPHNLTDVGVANFDVRVVDSENQEQIKPYSLTVANDKTPLTLLPNDSSDIPGIFEEMMYYAVPFYGINAIGTPNFSISFSSSTSNCQNWLTLNSSGVLKIETQDLQDIQEGTCNFTVEVSDDYDDVSIAFSKNVYSKVKMTTSVIPDTFLSTPYSTTLTATGGSETYNWEFSINPDASLNAVLDNVTGNPHTCYLEANPSSDGRFFVSIKVSDALNETNFDYKTYEIKVPTFFDDFTNAGLGPKWTAIDFSPFGGGYSVDTSGTGHLIISSGGNITTTTNTSYMVYYNTPIASDYITIIKVDDIKLNSVSSTFSSTKVFGIWTNPVDGDSDWSVFSNNGTNIQKWRSINKGNSAPLDIVTISEIITLPLYFKISREGTDYTFEISIDGLYFYYIGTFDTADPLHYISMVAGSSSFFYVAEISFDWFKLIIP